MRGKRIVALIAVVAVLSALALLKSADVFAHCDTMDGPVVKAAQKALESGDVNLVLVWVQKEDEAEIKMAFKRTTAVRKLTSEAKELADTYFFETIVRIHRAGEGEPYTGIKPAGLDLGPAIPAADEAIEAGNLDELTKLLDHTIQEGLEKSFKEVIEKKNYNKNDVEAGREYAAAYVTFVHYVEAIYDAAKGQAGEHHKVSEETRLYTEGHRH